MTTAATRSPGTEPTHYTPRTGVKAFAVFVVAATLASVAIVPYALTITGATIPDTPIWRWLLIIVAQNLVLIASLTALGLLLGPKVGLGAPLLYAWIEGRPMLRVLAWRSTGCTGETA